MAIAAACIVAHQDAPAFFLLALALCLSAVITMKLETGQLYSFLVTILGAGIILVFRGNVGLWVGIEMVLLWWLIYWAAHVVGSMKHEKRRVGEAIDAALTELAERQRERQRYQDEAAALAAQNELRARLVQGVVAIGKSFNPANIESALADAVALNFPGKQADILWFDALSDEQLDLYELWVKDHRASLLVTHGAKDQRFRAYFDEGVDPAHGERSLVAAPIVDAYNGGKRGMIKVQSAVPDAFSEEDMRVIDLYAVLANLAFENSRLHAQVREMAIHDALTGAYARKIFDEKLIQECARASRYGLPLSLALIDIDHFKKFNDTYGHQVGDALLKWLVNILKTTVREVDFVARYGGEEFAIVMPETQKARAAEVLELVRDAIDRQVCQAGGHDLHVTISVGIASFPDETTSPGQLLRAADERLYVAKGSGRNRVISY